MTETPRKFVVHVHRWFGGEVVSTDLITAESLTAANEIVADKTFAGLMGNLTAIIRDEDGNRIHPITGEIVGRT